MIKTFRPWNPEQTLRLPPSPVDWLPENHLVFFLLDLAAELDPGEIHAYYHQKDLRGEKAYDSRMMVVLLLDAYCDGLTSSRKIEKACWEDAAFRVLTGTSSRNTVGSATSAAVTWAPWLDCLSRCSRSVRRQGW
jgi:hypothetical protein